MNVDGGDLILGGSVDEGSVSALRTLLAGLSDSGQSVSVDLRAVDYLPSFAIGVLARARSRARAQGQEFDLVAPDGCPAQRILQIAAIPYVDGLDDDLDALDEPDDRPGDAVLTGGGDGGIAAVDVSPESGRPDVS